MTRMFLLVIAVVALGAGAAAAQAGSIGIFADQAGIDCDLHDNVAGLCTYYCVHVYHGGATACQFSAPKPSCMLATYLSDSQLYGVTLGNSQTGVAIGYGTCQVAPTYVLGINYFCQALTPLCCYYPVLPDPRESPPALAMTDCDFNLLNATGLTSVVNPDYTCCCNCTPAEESTWGKVKSLYSE